MAKRKFGSIRALPSGKYQARYTAPDGSTVKAPNTFFTQDDAAGWLRSEEKLIEFDQWTPPEQRDKETQDGAQTVGEWLARFYDIQESTGEIRASTAQTYRTTIEHRITPYRIAQTPIGQLTKSGVMDWWEKMTAEHPDSKTTNRRAYVALRSAMSYAVEKEYIPANPVEVKAAKRKAEPEKKKKPTVEELKAIVEHMPDHYRAGAVLCAFHGLRIGEMLAVRKKDVKDGEIHIKGNLQRLTNPTTGKNEMVRQAPKTKEGARTVPILAEYRDLIEGAAQATRNDEDTLVRTTTGKPVMDSSFRSVWNRARDRAGVRKEISPHYGRTWLTTTLAEQGATPAEIGKILGQRDIKTIVKTYMDVSDERPADAMAKVNAGLSNGDRKVTMNTTEKMAAGWFLAINQAERKRISHMDVRCDKGCLLAAGVTIDKELYALGITDSTKTETHPRDMSETIDAITGDTRRAGLRLTAEAVDALSVEEFLQGFRAVPRAFSMRDLAAADTGHRHGWLDPWDAVKAGETRVRARCRHLEGYIPVEVFSMDKKSQRLTKLDTIV